MPNDSSSEALWPFPTTHWSLVAQLRDASDEVRRRALGELLGRYLSPLKSHLVIHRKLNPDQAADMLQGFISSRILQGELLQQADQQRGRLRTYLATALDRYVANQFRDAGAQKRSSGPLATLDEELESPETLAPHEGFDLEWARHVLGETLQRMQDECKATGRLNLWTIFEMRIVKPLRDKTAPAPYAQLVRDLGLVSPGQASSTLIRARQLFVRILRSVVGEYARSEGDIDEEINDLWKILSRPRG
jgi:DNA-directed RNA polymerase specialized sigma24 family protein